MIAHRHTLALLAVGLLATAPLAAAQTEPQGLYSTEAILDAEVHLDAAPDTTVGDVNDILLGDDMGVHALVIRSNAALGLGGDDVVVTRGQFRLDTDDSADGNARHRVMLALSEEEFDALPRYDRNWWQEAQQRSREAWQSTQQGAESAWQRTREGANRVGDRAEQAWQRTQEGAERAGRAISDALDDMTRDE